MEQDEILRIFRECGALLEGHFKLSSGLHSGRYLQCALVLQHPEHAARLGTALAEQLWKLGGTPDLVIAPALGGILVAHEVARTLGVRGLFAERQDGTLTLRRGFHIETGERCFVVEDVLTTGLSTRETIAVAERAGGKVIAAGSLIDRSGGKVDIGIRRTSLVAFDVPAYDPQNCPLCAAGTQATKPGSR